MKNNTPLEAQEQEMLFKWANLSLGKYPELRLMFHIPNGGKRSKREAASLKRQGVKPGVPDIFLSVPKDGYHGFYIEMKRRKGSRTTADQLEVIEDLIRQGYKVEISKGWEIAKDMIIEYLKGGD